MSVKPTRLLLALGLVLASLLAFATPASATVYTAHGTMHWGRIDLQTQTIFGTINFDTPGSGVGACLSNTSVRAQFDDVANTVSNINVAINSPFTLPVFGGTYELEASTTATGGGTWNPTTGAWTGVRADLAFEIYTFTEAGCVRGTPVCRGTLDMEFSGTTAFGGEGPIPGASGPVWVDGTTERRITVGECSGIWATLLPGADVRIEDNPVNPMPGAEFR